MEHYTYDDDCRFDRRIRTTSGTSFTLRDSDEDTEDASETESMNPGEQESRYRYSVRYGGRPVEKDSEEMKDQCYRSRLAELHGQLDQLEAGTHPAWLSGLAKIQAHYEASKFELKAHFDWTLDRINREFETEKRAALEEFERRRREIKDSLETDLDEQRRRFRETEHHDLLMDAVEPRPVIRRQLRRRANDPTGASTTGADRQERAKSRARPSPSTVNYLLEEEQVNEDLKLLEKIVAEAKREDNLTRKAARAAEQQVQQAKNAASSAGLAVGAGGDHQQLYQHGQPAQLVEARIEDGKLFYNRKWFHRGQNIWVESASRENIRQAVNILQIGAHDLTLRRVSSTATTDCSNSTPSGAFSKQTNMKVTLADLQARKFTLVRRS